MMLRMAGLVALLLAAGTMSALAEGSPGPATRFTKWVCVIDLQQALGSDFAPPLPARLTTTATEKLCPGSEPNNVSITCLASVKGWTLGNKVYQGFTCQMFKGQCGAPAFVLGQTSKLTIKPDGSVTLECSSP
jgi:hypothetical protein